MVAGSGEFEVFCHIDYAVRAWPSVTAGPLRSSTIRGGIPDGHAGARRQRARTGDEHPAPEVVDSTVVGRGRWQHSHIRQ